MKRSISLIVLAVLVFCPALSLNQQNSDAYAAQKPTLNVLFIGNSYTFYNDFPTLLEKLVNSSSESPVRLHTEAVTQGGADFADHWEQGRALKAINQRKDWHYVVLQNQSNWASHPDFRKNALIYAHKFNQAITAAGAVPLVFITWPKEPGSTSYKQFPYLKNFGASYASLNHYSEKLARDIGGDTVPVNTYWAAALKSGGNVGLYHPDGSHPSPAGSYLCALVFYKYFTGKPLENAQLVPQNVNPSEAYLLQKIVATSF
ncbi:MAG: hypothetical protein KDJ75_00070 [Alphaproteobacteria bacterium]|nr:hypothetical protein [Alphaproteobacteria bacterium]